VFGWENDIQKGAVESAMVSPMGEGHQQRGKVTFGAR
jgi:hypothetical protein